jgi:hypothetical protein
MGCWLFLFRQMKSQRFVTAGKELIKGNIGNALKSVFVDERVIPEVYNGMSKEFWYFDGSGKEIHFTPDGVTSPITAYNKCAPLHSVINRKTRAYINGKTWLLDKKGKEATSGEAAKRLRKILKQPNAIQTWEQWDAQAYIYMLLWGYCPVLIVKPTGFDNSYATAIWNIPPFMCEIEENEDVMFYNVKSAKELIKSIKVTYRNKTSYLNLDFVFILRDYQPSKTSVIIPDSRTKALQMPINNIIGTYESRNVLINRRGASGILTQDPGTGQYGALPPKEGYKEALQEDYRKYGLLKGQAQLIITEASLKYQQIGSNTRDLMLFEEITDDIMRICEEYDYPAPLISTEKGPAVANTREYKQQVYEDGVIPESISIYSQINEMLATELYELKIDKDFSKLAILQKDKQQEAQARLTLNNALKIEFDAGLITLDQWLEKLGEDPLPNGLGQIRATDPKDSSVPLAVTIGVGGVQSLISVITANGMSEEARAAALEIVFGISPESARRMSVGSQQNSDSQNQNQNQNDGEEEEA